MLRSSLHGCGEDEESVADPDTTSAPVPVCKPSANGICDGRAEPSNGIDEAQPGACGVVHEDLPLRECLEAVHHGTIVSVGGGEHDQGEDTDVQLE